MKTFLWGAGKYAEVVWERFSEKQDVYCDDFAAVVDNNPELWGKRFQGRKIISPAELAKEEVDLIVITSTHLSDIRKQLMTELNIIEDKIYTYNQYRYQCYCNWIYRKRYGSIYEGNYLPVFNLDNLVIYTAITGEYDTLKDPLYIADGVKHICFTNNPNLKSNIWEIRYIDEKGSMDNVHLARHIKMNPHVFLPYYETSVWVDGKFQIMGDLREYVELYQFKSKMLCFPHFMRECICDEMVECIRANKGNKRDMILQVGNYLRDGYPLNNGLFETGCIVRAHNDRKVIELMTAWEKEITQYSIRDQLSFPYVCWKHKFEPDISDLYIYKNRWLKQFEHNEK